MGTKQEMLAQLLKQAGQPPEDVPAGDIGYSMWSMENQVPQSNDYDMQGFYKGLMSMDPAARSAINPNDQQMHFPDKWKLPNHPSFSTESQYYDPAIMPNTPTWSGGTLPNGGESWALRRPDGEMVMGEAPWFTDGIRKARP